MEIEEPSPDSSLHTQLHHFTSSGQWQRAKEVAGTLLSSQPESAWLHNCMGEILLQLNLHKEAETHFKKAVALMPDFADAYLGLAQVYISLNKAGTAEDNIRKCLALDPDDDHAWVLFAHLSLHFEDPNAAIQHANRALALNPDSTAARDVIIRAQGELKGENKLPAKQRIAEFENLLAENPESDLYHHRIGEIYLDELKDYKQAELHFRKALSIDPTDQSYQTSLIQALRKRDLVLRLLWLPYLPTKIIIKALNFLSDLAESDIKLKNIPLILLFIPAIFFIKPLIIILAGSFLLFGTIFWPLTKAYEYLTIADIHKKMGRVTLYKGPFAKIHKLPFYTRFLIFTLIVIAFWSTIAFLLANEKSRDPILGSMILLAAGSFILIIFLGLGYTIYQYFTENARNRKNKPFNQP